MYNWKAEIGDKVLKDSDGVSYGDIDLKNLEKFSVMNGDEEVGSVDLSNGKIEILGKVKVKAGALASRDLIWIKRNIAQPGFPLKTTYLLGYYEDGKKVCYSISEDGNAVKQK